MGHKTLVGGTAYDISGGKVLVGGTAYGIKKGRTLVGGTGYDISFGTPLSSVETGGSVYLDVDGVPTEFLVVHRGNPDNTIYDSSCDGVWLLMKDVKETYQWHGTSNSERNNNYKASDIHAYLNDDFFGRFDSEIQSAIKSVKIPYVNGTGDSGTLATGASGLVTKIFLLSVAELGASTSDLSTAYADGAKLDYFLSGYNVSAASALRKAYYNGSAQRWWTRSISKDSSIYAFYVGAAYEDIGAYNTNTARYVRPALILPHDTIIDENYNVVG